MAKPNVHSAYFEGYSVGTSMVQGLQVDIQSPYNPQGQYSLCDAFERGLDDATDCYLEQFNRKYEKERAE